jgi:Electron transfer DM13
MVLAITEEFGRLEEVFSEIVYPIWPVWLVAAFIALAAAAVVAYRLRWHDWALQHRLLTGAIVAVVLVVAVPIGWYTVSPLFDRETACEASPIAGAGVGSEKCAGVAAAAGNAGSATSSEPPSAGTAATAAPGTSAPDAPQATGPVGEAPAFEPSVVKQGEFEGADDFHFGRGQALLIETAPGEYTLRFENFSVRNGPDLFVYLSTDAHGYSDDSLLLGELKGTDGAFNYPVPGEIDVSQYQSAVVWCRAFSVLFATANFAPT